MLDYCWFDGILLDPLVQYHLVFCKCIHRFSNDTWLFDFFLSAHASRMKKKAKRHFFDHYICNFNVYFTSICMNYSTKNSHQCILALEVINPFVIQMLLKVVVFFWCSACFDYLNSQTENDGVQWMWLFLRIKKYFRTWPKRIRLIFEMIIFFLFSMFIFTGVHSNFMEEFWHYHHDLIALVHLLFCTQNWIGLFRIFFLRSLKYYRNTLSVSRRRLNYYWDRIIMSCNWKSASSIAIK